MLVIRVFLRKEAYLLLSLFAFVFWACQQSGKPTAETDVFIVQVRTLYAKDLDQTIRKVERLLASKSIEEKQQAFREARLAFKRVEPMLAFFNYAAYYSLNQPNLPKIEEDGNSNKIIKPTGFQVLEEELFQEEVNEEEIDRQSRNILHTLELEQQHPQKLASMKRHHFLWMFRDALLRCVALGISGFDSPIILNSLPENAKLLEVLSDYINLAANHFTDKKLAYAWANELTKAKMQLSENKSFNDFDRYKFIKEHIHPLLELWNQSISALEVAFPFPKALNYEAVSLFGANTFNLDKFAPSYSAKLNNELIALGEELFHDEQLSGNKKMSCGTCHIPEQAFTDGRRLAEGSDGSDLKRNTPTLYYAALQAAQFYDARSANLENQILQVVHNEKEFQGNIEELVTYVKNTETYLTKFSDLYQGTISSKTVRNALASYVRSLAPFNSKFDRNISGLANDIDQDEIDGFNLFMGKAKCGTCHFAPVFNGTVPPNFSDSELEVLGVPNFPAIENAKPDKDLGRFDVFGAELRKHAFKTPTVRNVSKTAPYMHNGIYQSLEEVIDFYNRGGGAGIGNALENQTLPPDELDLTKEEIRKLIAFLNALEDQPNQTVY